MSTRSVGSSSPELRLKTAFAPEICARKGGYIARRVAPVVSYEREVTAGVRIEAMPSRQHEIQLNEHG